LIISVEIFPAVDTYEELSKAILKVDRRLARQSAREDDDFKQCVLNNVVDEPEESRI
jgi:hypothetical protein